VFGYARSKSEQPVKGFPQRLGHEAPAHNRADPHFRDRHRRQAVCGSLPTSDIWSDLDPTYLPSGDVALRFRPLRMLAAVQRDGQGRNVLQSVRDARRRQPHPPSERERRTATTCPIRLNDGTIAYTRWEYEQRGWANIQSLWTVRPDGTGADACFKQHLNDPWALEDFRSIPGTQENKLVAIAAGPPHAGGRARGRSSTSDGA
jgi:hypothetical protein